MKFKASILMIGMLAWFAGATLSPLNNCAQKTAMVHPCCKEKENGKCKTPKGNSCEFPGAACSNCPFCYTGIVVPSDAISLLISVSLQPVDGYLFHQPTGFYPGSWKPPNRV